MRLDTTINRLEVHIRALAAAAAQAQMAMQSACIPGPRWSDRYDTLARNLAEPALDELTALRRVLRVHRIPSLNEGKPAPQAQAQAQANEQ
jgi:hypothetical protein